MRGCKFKQWGSLSFPCNTMSKVPWHIAGGVHTDEASLDGSWTSSVKFTIPIRFDLGIILPGTYTTNILVNGKRVCIQFNYHGMVRAKDWKPAADRGSVKQIAVCPQWNKTCSRNKAALYLLVCISNIHR